MKKTALGCICALTFLTVHAQHQYLVEAESFQHYGGWCLDHQAFPKIGSAYLMAHGMGKPVADATHHLTVDRAGDYHLYVSTYNWTSPWYDGAGPGAFQCSVNGKKLSPTLGTEGKNWGWQYAGKVHLDPQNEIRLHDLTGFNGRVDALYFTDQPEQLPATYEEYLTFRTKKLGYDQPEVTQSADLIVVGGGVAGCATALTAARQGLKVVLVDNLSKLGGNNYLGVKMCGLMRHNKYPHLGDAVRELSGISSENYQDNPAAESVRENGNGFPVMSDNRDSIAQLREQILTAAGVEIYHQIHVYQTEVKDRRLVSVKGRHLTTNQDFIFRASLFADCTGDGEVGYLSGAEFMIGRENRAFAHEPSAPVQSDFKMLGATLNWEATPKSTPTTFPDNAALPWAMPCSANYYVDMPASNWTWETGFEINNAEEAELVRDNMLRAIYGNWAYLKNHLPKYKNYSLDYVTTIAQKRESRRLKGDLILNENDIRQQIVYPDASFTTTWTLDLHFPQARNHKFFPGWEWRSGCPNKNKKSWIQPYHVPYRVLYSKDLDNLFIGGRCMSVTHIALGTVRVQATLGMAGEVIGMAAKICNEHKATPREVYQKYLEILQDKMTTGK